MFELLFVHPVWAYRAGTLSFASSWPRWLLLALIVAATAIIIASLWRRRFLGLPRVLAIGALQIALATLILCLLWRPVLNVERVRDRQNVLAIAVDNSGSMHYQDDGNTTPRLQQAISALQAGPLAQLAKTFELRFFAFDSATTPIDSLAALPTAGTQSRIGDALLTVLQTASSVPLAGVLLISDGAENGRSLSEAKLHDIAAYGVPVHTVGVGPERIDNDLELVAVDMPANVAPGAIVTADVDVRHQGAVTTRLRVYDDNTLLAARELKLLAGTAKTDTVTRTRIEFPAGVAGVRDLRFTVEPLANERNQINNTRRQVLNVPSARRNILYIEGEPRWEFKFIRRAVESEKSLRLASVVRTTQNKFYRQGVSSGEELVNGLPTTAKELFAYDAVIIGSYEAPALTPAQHELLKEFVDRRGGSVLLLAARSGLADGGWGNSALAQAMPVHLSTKRGNDFVQAPVKALLTSYGVESTTLRFDADRERNLEQWQSLPALANFQRVGNLKPGAVVLLEHQLKSERAPLLVWQRYGRGSVYVLATASTQRWQMSLPADDQRHEMFWRQLLHALADQAPQPVWLSAGRQTYDDERSVQMEVELRDEKFELMSGARPQVALVVTPENGAPIVQALQSVAGRYVTSIDAAATGLYKAEVIARIGVKGEQQVLSASTAFRRDDNVVEHFDMQQQRAVLQRIATDTSGRYWQLDQLDALSAAIPYTKSGIVERQMLDLWNLPLIFLLLLVLKLGEWLLRLKWGTL